MTIDRIRHAEYFLHKIRGKSSREELRPNLTAFLAISRGIIDHLHEEYNVKIEQHKVIMSWQQGSQTFSSVIYCQNQK